MMTIKWQQPKSAFLWQSSFVFPSAGGGGGTDEEIVTLEYDISRYGSDYYSFTPAQSDPER